RGRESRPRRPHQNQNPEKGNPGGQRGMGPAAPPLLRRRAQEARDRPEPLIQAVAHALLRSASALMPTFTTYDIGRKHHSNKPASCPGSRRSSSTPHNQCRAREIFPCSQLRPHRPYSPAIAPTTPPPASGNSSLGPRLSNPH